MNHFDPDPAAVFGIALSLYTAGTAKGTGYNISELFNGQDQFMRCCMAAGSSFEKWACNNVDFESLVDVWPYTLEDGFADAYARAGYHIRDLNQTDHSMWPKVAAALKLSLKTLDKGETQFELNYADGPKLYTRVSSLWRLAIGNCNKLLAFDKDFSFEEVHEYCCTHYAGQPFALGVLGTGVVTYDLRDQDTLWCPDSRMFDENLKFCKGPSYHA